MMLFDVVLFAHIAVVLCAISLAAVLHTAEWSARRAKTVAELRVVTRPYKYGVLFAPIVILLLGLGMWLVHLSKGHDDFHLGAPWIWTAMVALVVLFSSGPAVMGPHSKALDAVLAAAPDGPVGPDVRAVVLSPAAWIVGNAMTTLALGVVFNMTTKPGIAGAVAVLVVALASGATVGYLGSRSTADALT